ncbi:MAG: NTP transferase domain-containing protein [[Clostridium] scindens]
MIGLRYGAVVTVAEISSQMGEFKPMLPIGKETMIQRVVRTLRKADVEDVVVITGYRHEVIEENLNDAGVMFLKNERFIQGDWIDSVKMGMEWLDDKCDKILAIPGDIPMVMENTIRELLAKEGEFAYPTFQGEPGYPIVLGSQAAAGLTNAISTEEYQAKPNAIEHLLEITKGLVSRIRNWQ